MLKREETLSRPLNVSNDAESTDRSTEASLNSLSDLDEDAALLSSTLVKVHSNTDGWRTGNWESTTSDKEERGIVASPERTRERTKFSLCSMACCGNVHDTKSFDERETFMPYKLSRRRSSLKPRVEIECTLKEGRDDVQAVLSEESESIPRPSNSDSTESAISKSFPPASEWTHTPLLLTATPGSSTIVRRIRRVCDPSYFEDGHLSDGCDVLGPHDQLPINSGKEDQGCGLVIDFETPSFEGTAFFRIRNANKVGSLQQLAHNGGCSDYFASYNRKFQMVIRGKFRRPDVAMADCMTGMLLDNPLRTAGSTIADPFMACSEIPSGGSVVVKKSKKKRFSKAPGKDENLPPKWVLRASVKIAGLFSPRMDADLECEHPRILSPLCSMAQSIHVARGVEPQPLDVPHAEPPHASKTSLVYELNHKGGGSSSNTSVQIRKKAFDSIYDTRISQCNAHPKAHSSQSPCFDPNATYTFEFLQHLIDYNDFSLDFGSLVGKMKLGGALKGQPCRFVAGVVGRGSEKKKGELGLEDLDCLWSFDLWHESLCVGREVVR